MGTKSTQMVFSSRNMILREPLFFWLQCPAAAPGTCVCMIRPPARWPSTGSWQKDPCSSTASAMHPPLEIPLRSLWVVLCFILVIIKDRSIICYHQVFLRAHGCYLIECMLGSWSCPAVFHIDKCPWQQQLCHLAKPATRHSVQHQRRGHLSRWAWRTTVWRWKNM